MPTLTEFCWSHKDDCIEIVKPKSDNTFVFSGAILFVPLWVLFKYGNTLIRDDEVTKEDCGNYVKYGVRV